MTRRIQRRAFGLNQDVSWRKLPLETIAAVWRLARGGMTPAEIADRMELHGATVKPLVEFRETFFFGMLPVAKPVRCVRCGHLITVVPCGACGPGAEHYSVPTREASLEQV